MHPIARAAALALLTLTGLASAPVAAAQDAAPWTVATAANDFGAGRENYSYTVDAGGQVDDGLVVANPGTAPLDLAVYSADAFTTREGRLDLLTRDKPSTGVGAWVRPGAAHVTVQPGQTTEVPFTVTVPADAAPGDHTGGIVTSLTENGVERRVGLRIQVRVGGELRPQLAVENLDVDYSGTLSGSGDATLTYTVHNTGNATVSARQAVSVSGPFGSWRATADPVPDTPSLLPGETRDVSVPVHGVVPALALTGTVTLTPLLTDASGSVAPLAAVSTTAHGAAVPWALVGLIVVVAAVAVFALRRRRSPVEEPEKVDVTV
ncbi:hypothetical protein FHX82_004898 [Amycolatopsis bartoniae]|uniref:DUF916 domain-containing protein n=1 Tax=Amycolatopsis bartoniae TaxID=941986 RepID=A0A8H9ITR8_9PSEU|nr:DUF916 domain-containing protein [Amycolatopsis bartoniae]MBB2937822.1 hypothetical protein [Amycolatopsis bartoniae]TVT06514.1 DUF916 domain-containing protein [Amycolatopsis bartoniae]GHF40967.1 hypothetical protein GCM10017566_13000 [Amycolatopsis bartoniae]